MFRVNLTFLSWGGWGKSRSCLWVTRTPLPPPPIPSIKNSRSLAPGSLGSHTLYRLNTFRIQLRYVLKKSYFFHKTENLQREFHENNYSCYLFLWKHSIVDIWQEDSEYTRVSNMLEFWIYHGSGYASGSDYTSVLIMPSWITESF